MKIEKVGNQFRVRKMINCTKYTMTFDHEPKQSEIKRELSRLMHEQPKDDTPKGTFEYYAKKYMQIQDNILSPSTLRSYGFILDKLSSEFKRKQLKDITQADVQTEINIIAKNKSPKTVRNNHAFISAVIKMYRPNLMLHTKLPQKIKKQKTVPLRDDIKAVLDEVKDTRYYIPYRLAVYGLRRGEICAITALDISDDNILTINKDKVYNGEKKWVIKPYPKTTDSQRTIYIDNELADLIRKQGYAFNGHPSRLYDNLKHVQDRLGIERFRFHDFRAYMVTELSQAGYSEADIMKMGGWSTPNIMKSAYRQSRIQKELETQKNISSTLTL